MSIDWRELWAQFRWIFVGWSDHVRHWWIAALELGAFAAGIAAGWGLFGTKKENDNG